MNPTYVPVTGSQPRRRRGNHWESDCPFRRRVETSSSDLEDQIDVLLSLDPTVDEFCEQALRIHAVIDGEPHSSILDYWIRLHDQRELFREAKYESDLAERASNPRLDLQLCVQERWSADGGHNYGLLTDALTRRHTTRIRNGKLVLGFLRTNYPEGRRDLLCTAIGLLLAVRPYSYGELMVRFHPSPSALIAQAVLSLLVTGHATADLDTEPLNADTMFREFRGPLDDHPLAIKY